MKVQHQYALIAPKLADTTSKEIKKQNERCIQDRCNMQDVARVSHNGCTSPPPSYDFFEFLPPPSKLMTPWGAPHLRMKSLPV